MKTEIIKLSQISVNAANPRTIKDYPLGAVLYDIETLVAEWREKRIANVEKALQQ